MLQRGALRVMWSECKFRVQSERSVAVTPRPAARRAGPSRGRFAL